MGNTHVADVFPSAGVVWLPPVDKASEGLDDLNGFPIFSKGSDGKLVGKFLARPIHFGFKKFGAGHEESGEQEGTP